MLRFVESGDGQVKLIRRPAERSRRELARTYRWVAAWLIAGAVLALLLLGNSIRDYLFVWRILAVRQVRQDLSQNMVALEQMLRRAPTPDLSPPEMVAELMNGASEKPLWIEIRRPDGTVLARQGEHGNEAVLERRAKRPFSRPQASLQGRGRFAQRGRGRGLPLPLAQPDRPSASDHL
jgi:hypothetical protein